MHAVADVLVDALLRLILAQAANDHAETVSTTWEAENPMPTSKRGRRRWLKRLDAHRETFIPAAWQALMQAEADFTEAQTALAAVPIAGMGDLRIMIAAAELYDGIELCRINRAPIARAVVAYFARTAEGGAVVRTNNKAPGLWIVSGTDGMACNSAVETGAEGKVSAKGHERLQAATGTAFDEPLSAKNGCLRKKRHEAWREAEAATRY
jgi:hypothetical protein